MKSRRDSSFSMTGTGDVIIHNNDLGTPISSRKENDLFLSRLGGEYSNNSPAENEEIKRLRSLLLR
jgi:hypothetical protein